MTKVLAIETSCDETACAILESTATGIKVLANIVSSQASLHASYGGVVPQLAAREHIRNIVPVISEALTKANFTETDIDFIAVTEGPGLMPALLIGVNAAKTLALIWDKPLMGVQHLEGHIYANLLTNNKQLTTNNKTTGNQELGIENSKTNQNSKFNNQNSILEFPLIALIVSGGHTELVLMQDHFQYEILGETQDDASGEAFDKVAKILGLPYPGGPEVAARADEYRTYHEASTIQHLTAKLPRPMLTTNNFDFSFSGLKTAVLYAVQKESDESKASPDFIPSICHAFQEAVVDVLVGKTKKALALYNPITFVIAGGVSANVRLRERLSQMIKEECSETHFLTPEFQYSLDNAAMIGSAALMRYERLSPQEKENLRANQLALDPNPNLALL